LEIRSHFFPHAGLDHNSPILGFSPSGMTGTHYHTQYLLHIHPPSPFPHILLSHW
jgi:hypothetical protein